jgi:hypothetical protein
MPPDLVEEADMTEKDAALSEIYNAKKDSLESYLARLQAMHTV